MSHHKKAVIIQFLNFMLVCLFSCKCGEISINSVVDRSKNNLQVLIDNVRQLEDLSPRILTKANKIRNSHILTNESPEFFCSQKLGDITSEKSLFCWCAGKGAVVDIYTGGPYWSIINTHNQKERISKLYLLSCNFSIGNLALKSLNLKRLTELTIAGSNFLSLWEDSLAFSNKQSNVTLFKIENPIDVPKLHPSVSSITFDEVTINSFSTDNFVPSSVIFLPIRYRLGDIVIRNSDLIPTNIEVDIHAQVEVNSLKFENVVFLSAPRYRFINIEVKNDVTFYNMSLEAGSKHLMDITGAHLYFINCTIVNWRPSAMHVRVGNASFLNTKLQEPQKNALMDITFLDNNTSTLKFCNILLDDPAEGTLVTNFPNVMYHSIFVQRCKCDLVHYLITTQKSVAGKIFSDGKENGESFVRVAPKRNVEIELSRSIKCLPLNGSSWIYPNALCKDDHNIDISMKHKNMMIIVSCSLFLIFLSIIILLVMYSRKKEQEKANLVNNWTFHAPTESQAIKEENDCIRYLSPADKTSVFSMIDTNVEMREGIQPEMMIDYASNNLYPSLILPLHEDNKSIYTNSRVGSMIVHEDLKEWE